MVSTTIFHSSLVDAALEEHVDLRDHVEGDLLGELRGLGLAGSRRCPWSGRTARPSPRARRPRPTGRSRPPRACTTARSCSGFSAITIWIVEQFGLAMMLRSRKRSSASGLTSGTTSGTCSSMRNCEVLSITTQPAAAARGAWILEIAAPGENSPRSVPSKSKVSSALTFSRRSSPNETSLPSEPLRGQRHHLVGRELALRQDAEDLVADRAGRADHRHLVAHRRFRLHARRSREHDDRAVAVKPEAGEVGAMTMTSRRDRTAARRAAHPWPDRDPAPIRLEAAAARRLVLPLAGLADPPGRKLTADGLLALIEHLGFVQVDSIQTVARAHHMILFARNETLPAGAAAPPARGRAAACSSTGPTASRRSSRPASTLGGPGASGATPRGSPSASPAGSAPTTRPRSTGCSPASAPRAR